MRITNLKLKKKKQNEIEKITLSFGGINDELIATDFSKDIYSVLKTNKPIIKSIFEIFNDLNSLYVEWKIKDLNNSIKKHFEIKKFIEEFLTSETYIQLKKLTPTEGLIKFFELISDENNSDCAGKNKSKKKNSANLDDISNQIKKTDLVIKSGLLDEEDSIAKCIINGKLAGKTQTNTTINNLDKKLIDEICKKIKNRNLIIFKVARHKKLLDKFKNGTFYDEINHPSDEMTIDKINKVSDFFRILPSQLATDDDIFYLKLAKKELLYRKYLAKKQRKQALYLLLDVSWSMEGVKTMFATATALSLIEQAINKEATYFLRFFNTRVSELYKVTNKKDVEKISIKILNNDFFGGGTIIDYAIKTAIDDIKKDKTKFEHVEIMLITDGEDSIRTRKDVFVNTKLHTTIIDAENNALKEISDTYTKISSRELSKKFNLEEDMKNLSPFYFY